MSRFFVTGDYHGGLDKAKLEEEVFPEGYGLTRDDYVIILGDFGLPWDSVADNSDDLGWLESRPWTTLFVDGNHEYYPAFEDLPEDDLFGGRVQCYEDWPHIIHLMRGETYQLGGTTAFVMGGATSVDKAWRVPGETWFAEELPDEYEYDRALASLDDVDWQVDYVLTHTCADRMLGQVLRSDEGQIDHDQLTGFLDNLEDRLTYRRWYFGHFHYDEDIDDRHTVLYQEVVELGKALYDWDE